MKRLLFYFIPVFVSIFFLRAESSVSFHGEWFSDVRRQPKGFDARELYLFESFNSKKFVFSQINFNETRKWEETRYSGKWDFENTKTANLKAENCSVYASKELGKRWALIRAFDCDHLSFRVEILSEKQITVSPSMDFENPELFQRSSSDPDSIQSLIILTDSENFTSWGIRTNKIRKGSSSFIAKKSSFIPVQAIETVDSSATYKNSRLVEIGDILVTKNQKPKGGLD